MNHSIHDLNPERQSQALDWLALLQRPQTFAGIAHNPIVFRVGALFFAGLGLFSAWILFAAEGRWLIGGLIAFFWCGFAWLLLWMLVESRENDQEHFELHPEALVRRKGEKGSGYPTTTLAWHALSRVDTEIEYRRVRIEGYGSGGDVRVDLLVFEAPDQDPIRIDFNTPGFPFLVQLAKLHIAERGVPALLRAFEKIERTAEGRKALARRPAGSVRRALRLLLIVVLGACLAIGAIYIGNRIYGEQGSVAALLLLGFSVRFWPKLPGPKEVPTNPPGFDGALAELLRRRKDPV